MFSVKKWNCESGTCIERGRAKSDVKSLKIMDVWQKKNVSTQIYILRADNIILTPESNYNKYNLKGSIYLKSFFFCYSIHTKLWCILEWI